MIVDGRKVAEAVFDRVRTSAQKLGRAPKLCIVTCAPTFETKKYLSLKQARAKSLGIETELIELAETSSTDMMRDAIKAHEHNVDGIIVQLPLPHHIDVDAVLDSIPRDCDVDAFRGAYDDVLPPVVGAIKEIAQIHQIEIRGKRCVVVGSGRLVGAPAATWLTRMGGNVAVVTKKHGDISALTREADVIVLGAGSPGLLKPDMVREGAVIFDAGTSEEGGKLRGDADGDCAKKAALFTPVPGGIGPITIAVLFQNLIALASRRG